MGQYAYLINRENKICCESHKTTGGGEDKTEIEDPDRLARFLNHCMVNELLIECVSEHFFEHDDFYTEFV